MKDGITLERHPLSALFPPQTDEEYSITLESIKKHGWMDNSSIILLDGKILDGWHRFSAGLEIGLSISEMQFIEFNKLGFKGTAEEFVIENQLGRRNMTTEQKAIMALERINTTVGRQAKDLNTSHDVITMKDAAKLYGVSVSSIDRARRYSKGLSEEQIKEAKAGNFKLKDLQACISLPIEETVKSVTKQAKFAEEIPTPFSHWVIPTTEEEKAELRSINFKREMSNQLPLERLEIKHDGYHEYKVYKLYLTQKYPEEILKAKKELIAVIGQGKFDEIFIDESVIEDVEVLSESMEPTKTVTLEDDTELCTRCKMLEAELAKRDTHIRFLEGLEIGEF